MVELLLKHGARVDVEARMCWPGPHQQNCEERGKNAKRRDDGSGRIFYRSSDKLQCAIYYAIDGDQVGEVQTRVASNGRRCAPSAGGHPRPELDVRRTSNIVF